MPAQLRRLIPLFILFIGIFLLIRHFLVPDTFGQYGHYRGNSLEENASLETVYADVEDCKACHYEVQELLENDPALGGRGAGLNPLWPGKGLAPLVSQAHRRRLPLRRLREFVRFVLDNIPARTAGQVGGAVGPDEGESIAAKLLLKQFEAVPVVGDELRRRVRQKRLPPGLRE